MDDQKLLALDLSTTSWEVIDILAEDSSEPEIFEEIAKANLQRPDILRLLMKHSNTPQNVKSFISAQLHLPEATMKHHAAVDKSRGCVEGRHESLTTKIQMLSVSARVQLAMKGGREIRGVLARDPNKQVALSVLENGKITITEIELIAKNRGSIEESLRVISKNREWMKNYSVVHALLSNPKTPPGVAVAHVSRLSTKDLIILERNKNVSEILRIAAKKLLHARKPA